MTMTAEDLGGWWVVWIATGAVVVVVAALVLILTATARKIAALAMDASRSLEIARDRTGVLWRIATMNRVIEQILEGTLVARRALGGDVGDEIRIRPGPHTPEEIVGDGVKTAQEAVKDSLPPGPHIDPQEGRS